MNFSNVKLRSVAPDERRDRSAVAASDLDAHAQVRVSLVVWVYADDDDRVI